MMNKYYFSEDSRESLPNIMDKTFTENQLKEVYLNIIDTFSSFDGGNGNQRILCTCSS